MKTVLFASAALLGATFASGAQAQTPARPLGPSDPAAACMALRNSTNTANFAMLQDTPTSIQSAKVIPAGGTHGKADDDLPEICRIEGQIAPQIGFLLRMPTKTWNGKFMMGGCGGPCGNYLEDRIDQALVRNYAVVTTDMGHKGSGWMFALNNPQGQIDFAYRATHLTVIAAKAVIAAYYGAPASRNYYFGCSTGGRQGMIEAQRFPTDFEGIITGAPVYDEIGDAPYFLDWGKRVNIGPDGNNIMNTADVTTLHKAVLAQCDAIDGVKDGVLQNPAACRFDPKSIICKGGVTTGCLTAAQADVAQKIHDGARNSKGEKLYWGMPWGSEDQWGGSGYGMISGDGKTHPVKGTSITGIMGFATPKIDFETTDFDYDRDPARLDLNGSLYNPVNPDLSRFRAAGGKFILYHGMNDNNIPYEASTDYYEKAVKANGGLAETKTFFRYFTPPSVNHCRGGEGGGEGDWISALENWVEKGQAPDEVIMYRPINPYPVVQKAMEDYGGSYSKLGRHPMAPGSYDRARPVYAYPGMAYYKGSGDPNVPSSWKNVSK